MVVMMRRTPAGQRTSFILPEVVPFQKWFDSFLFLDWLIYRWSHFFRFCLFSFVWLYLSPECIYTWLSPHVLLSFVLSGNPALYHLCVIADKWDLESLYSS